MEFGYLLDRAASRFPHKTAIVFEDNRYTFTQFNRRVNCLANALLDLEIKHQDRIGIVCHNSNNYLEIVFACAKIGAISTHFNWRLPAEEIQALVKEAGCKFVFISTKFPIIEEVLKKCPSTKMIYIGDSPEEGLIYEQLIQSYPAANPGVAVGENDILLQIYTSGTTGYPKGTMFTHSNIIRHCLANIIDTNWTEQDIFLFSLPLFHASASGVYNSIISGSTTIIQDGFQIEKYLEAIRRERVTAFGIVPVMLCFLVEYPKIQTFDLSSLKKIIYGSAPINIEVLKRSLQLFKCDFYQLFGMTEMGPVISVLRPEDHNVSGTEEEIKKLTSAGKAAIGAIVKVVDEEGKDCFQNQIGEIITKGPGIMKGYFNMDEETQKAMKNGWFYTGDLGYFDEEGYLYVVDRKSDMLISGGENIYPKEIEDCIRLLTDDIFDVAVIGVPDDKWGETVKALVIKKENSSITADEIIKHCEKTIASYKKPKSVEFVESLPRNSTGKIQKHLLKERYWLGKERRI